MCCNSGGTRIIQLGGGAQPFSFEVTAGTGPSPLGPITSGPFLVDNITNRLHFWSINTIDFNITTGSANVQGEVRIDPNINNIITASPLGLLVDGSSLPSGVNLYNSDGTITDPTRTVTIGNSYLLFDAQDINSQSNIYIDKFVNNIFTYDTITQTQNTVTTDLGSAVMQSNNPADNTARVTAIADAVKAELRHEVIGGLNRNNITQFADGVSSYIDIANDLGTFFELRLNGDPGTAGYVITSNGPGVSPVWAPAGSCFINITDDVTTTQIDCSETITFQGGSLTSATVTGNIVSYSVIPGANGQIAYTIAGTPTWAFPEDIFNNILFSTNVNWDFGGNDWDVTNVDLWDVTANNILFKAPTIDINTTTFNVSAANFCITGIPQNNALTRVLVIDAGGGCMAWRDASTLTGTGGLTDIVSLRQTVFGGQGFVNNVETDITWETAEIDTSSIATVGAGTGFITIATTGIYEIHTAINWDTQLNNTGFRQIGIKINGVTDFLTSKLVTENPVMYLDRILNLTAGDVITVYGFHQTFPGTIRTKVNPTQNEASLLTVKRIG